MRWYVFTAAVVITLIALGIAAVDERDVLWEGRDPICPHCRAEVAPLSVFCRACDRNFDWVPGSEECRWCLDREDARHLRTLFEALGADREPLPGGLAPFPTAYFRAMEAGACTYCAGLDVVMDGDAKLACPVCRGSGACIGCRGDRVMQLGDPTAHRAELARREVRRRAEERAELTRQQVDLPRLVDADVDALAGTSEAEQLQDEQGRLLLPRARGRVAEAFRALHAELAGRGAAPPAGAGEGTVVAPDGEAGTGTSGGSRPRGS